MQGRTTRVPTPSVPIVPDVGSRIGTNLRLSRRHQSRKQDVAVVFRPVFALRRNLKSPHCAPK